MIEQLQKAVESGNTAEMRQIIAALSEKNHSVVVLIPLINICMKEQQFDLALKIFKQAIQQNLHPKQIVRLLNEEFFKGHSRLAIDFLTIAYNELPNNNVICEYYVDRLMSLEHYTQAEDVLSQIIQQRPEPIYLAKLSECYYRQAKLHEAKATALIVQQMCPHLAKSYINLAVVEKALGNLSTTAQLLQKAIEIEPDNFYAHINFAHLALLSHEFELGWQEYEYRWQDSHCIQLDLPLPSWNGEQEGHLLLWADQGLGDQIMFLNLMAKLQTEITLKIDPRLRTLIEPLLHERVHFITDEYQGDYSEFDFCISLGSLGRYLVRSIDDIQPQAILAKVPHSINSKAQLESELKAKIYHFFDINDDAEQPLFIGISWRGGNYRTNALGRNIPLEILSDLLEAFVGDQSIKFINLQYDATSDEIELLAKKGVYTPDFDLKNDLVHLSILMTSFLTKFISVDNSIVHLAGALGVNTDLLLSSLADWRWFYESDCCRWYESVRICRNLPLIGCNSFDCLNSENQTLSNQQKIALTQLKHDFYALILDVKNIHQ
ncbi:hypothetical protein MAH1_29800 [Sessilibacter sp. MAH1]